MIINQVCYRMILSPPTTASWSIDVDTGESAKSTALGAATTGTRETDIVGGLKYSSNIDFMEKFMAWIIKICTLLLFFNTLSIVWRLFLFVDPLRIDSLRDSMCWISVAWNSGTSVFAYEIKFLAKLAEESLPFFKTLKKYTKKSDFHWTEEAEVAFKQMKQLIAELPTLIALKEKEELIVYLAAAKEAVSAVLMTEREANQMPIYFIIRPLRGPEMNYTSMEILVLALPIKQVSSKPEVAGRLQKWSIVLGEYAIHYRSRVSVKGQILADFIVERLKEDDPDTAMVVEEELPEPWTLFTDGLRIAEEMGVKNLQENMDSRLVANQVNETYIAKEADMIRYLEKLRTLTSSLRTFSIKQVSRSENKKANALSKIASTSFAHLSKQVYAEELKDKSINELEVLAVVEEEGNT
uniref:Reverse transcriptase domain-containing protein n=1 Tax=Tanacetum cinerariifolium TaxID=118510 RepID=A0A6L2L5J0_TANCI|nr:reverse transcriptase domain-containing protein [Tanacetum cinerariifolium]